MKNAKEDLLLHVHLVNAVYLWHVALITKFPVKSDKKATLALA